MRSLSGPLFRSRILTLAVLALPLLLLATGCDDDGPTEPSHPDISGNWQGIYQPGITANFDPCDQGGPATATFSQTGSSISGSLTTQNPSLVEGSLSGEFLQREFFRGTVTNHGTTRNVTGTASATQIVLAFEIANCSASSRIELHR